MKKHLKILMLEDSKPDAELIQYTLKKSGIDFTIKVVEARKEFEDAIKNDMPDVILSDHSLPQFNSTEALNLYKHYNCNIPFILVTGSVSEEFAVQSIKDGADDYILKSNLIRLPAAIEHALKTRQAEKENQTVQNKLILSEIQVRRFATHLHHVLEDERSRIAREIHDELGQQLAGIKMGAALLKKQNNSTDQKDEKISEMIKDVDFAIQSLRKIATQLRPGILDTLGLSASIEWLSKEFEKKNNITCHFHKLGIEENIEKTVSICFFRICQEALTNILKHAEAKEVTILLKQDENGLTLEVADNGKGITSEKLENPFSTGLIGMRERANIIKATFDIVSKKNEGTTVKLNKNNK